MKKGIVLPLILFFASVTLIISILVILDNRSKAKNQNPSQASSESLIDEVGYSEATESVNREATRSGYTNKETANWKTYTNTKYEFSIIYPSDLKIYDNDNKYAPGFVNFRKESESGLDGDCIAIWLNIHSIKSENIKKWIMDNRKRIKPDNQIVVPEIYSYTNGDITGYWIETGSESIGKTIFVQEGEKYLEISSPGCVNGDHYKHHNDTSAIIDEMIRTFKFLDQ